MSCRMYSLAGTEEALRPNPLSDSGRCGCRSGSPLAETAVSHILLDQSLAAVHSLSAAAWFGALVYRAAFVDPKALLFFQAGSEFERFSLHLADGMRFVVLAALLTCGLSGFALMGLRWDSSDGWVALMIGKGGLWAVASALFVYISWTFWPRRVFAAGAETARIRRQGVLLALAMIAIAGLGMLCGQVAQELRGLVAASGSLAY